MLVCMYVCIHIYIYVLCTYTHTHYIVEFPLQKWVNQNISATATWKHMHSGQNGLFIFMPCTNWGRPLSKAKELRRSKTQLNKYYNRIVGCSYFFQTHGQSKWPNVAKIKLQRNEVHTLWLQTFHSYGFFLPFLIHSFESCHNFSFESWDQPLGIKHRHVSLRFLALETAL